LYLEPKAPAPRGAAEVVAPAFPGRLAGHRERTRIGRPAPAAPWITRRVDRDGADARFQTGSSSPTASSTTRSGTRRK